MIYRMLKYDTEFADAGQQEYEERYRSRIVHNLTRRAKEMGFKHHKHVSLDSYGEVTQKLLLSLLDRS